MNWPRYWQEIDWKSKNKELWVSGTRIEYNHVVTRCEDILSRVNSPQKASTTEETSNNQVD